MIKNNLEKGIPWRFGPDWPGQRCGAKTRKGTPCQRPAYKRNGRCSLHGGKSTGPKTEDGLARLTAARTTHGKYTKEKRAEALGKINAGGGVSVAKMAATSSIPNCSRRELMRTISSTPSLAC